MPDWKNIGLTGKRHPDGCRNRGCWRRRWTGGAQGAQQIDRGLDRVLDMAGVQQQKAPLSNEPGGSRLCRAKAGDGCRQDDGKSARAT